MLNKLKNTVVSKIREEEGGESVRKKIDISILSGEDSKNFRKALEKIQENIGTIDDISKQNRKEIIQFIKERSQKVETKINQQKGGQDEDQQEFTFGEDLTEIKQSLKEIIKHLQEMEAVESSIKIKVHQIQENEGASNVKNMQQVLQKYESEITNLRKSEQNNKQILSTLSQQSQLYIKEMKQLQEKSSKLQKQLAEKNSLVNNLREQKVVLLQMRNNDSKAQIPEVQGLKVQISQIQKRLTLERTRVEQKQKQIEGLKKKMEEDRESLEKIADQLKEKQLKSKKIIDKYERSKTEIRKYREEKTQFIKQLNMEVAKMAEELANEKKDNQSGKKKIQQLEGEIERLQSQVSKNQNRKIELQSSQSELVQVRKELFDKNMNLQKQKAQFQRLHEANEQLQNKRKQLLEALEKPVSHEIRTLQKILRALDKLYKQYITTVFQDGNVIGFENKITYIISNVQQIKEDLLL